MNKTGQEPRSLLRRLLKQTDEPTKPVEGQALEVPSGPTPDVSPVRPDLPTPTPSPTPLAPKTRTTPPPPARPAPPPPPINVEDRLKAELALEKLRQKTALVAKEFADGNLNRAQFVAMYAHYNEKRIIIERLLTRDPGTQAWQTVATPGLTTFLREHYEARVLSFAVYDLNTNELISSQGEPLLPIDLANKIITAIRMVLQNHQNLSAQRKALENDQWAVFIPGRYTVAIVTFSLEPSSQQVRLVQDLHRDFERANRQMLERGVRQAEQLVFPYRALFGRPG